MKVMKTKPFNQLLQKIIIIPVRSDYLNHVLNFTEQIFKDEGMEPYDDVIWRELKHALEDAKRKTNQI